MNRWGTTKQDATSRFPAKRWKRKDGGCWKIKRVNDEKRLHCHRRLCVHVDTPSKDHASFYKVSLPIGRDGSYLPDFIRQDQSVHPLASLWVRFVLRARCSYNATRSKVDAHRSRDLRPGSFIVDFPPLFRTKHHRCYGVMPLNLSCSGTKVRV